VKSATHNKNEPVARYLSIIYNLLGDNISLFLKQKNKRKKTKLFYMELKSTYLVEGGDISFSIDLNIILNVAFKRRNRLIKSWSWYSSR